MTSQKGFDLVAYIMDELLATEDVQLAVLGTGEDQYQDMFRSFDQKYPDKIQATIGLFRGAGTSYLRILRCLSDAILI